MDGNLAMQVKVALTKKQMTQAELANILGISGAYLSDLLNGRRKSKKQIDLIKTVLDIKEETIS